MFAKSLSPKTRSAVKKAKTARKNKPAKDLMRKPDDLGSAPSPKMRSSLVDHLRTAKNSTKKFSFKSANSASQEDLKMSVQQKFQSLSRKFSPIKNIHSKANADENLLPMSSSKAIEAFASYLSKFELSEMLDYEKIYYLGIRLAKKKPNIKLKNMGFDNEATDYIISIGDHIAYQYEIKELLGSGSFSQVCKCWDHKHQREVALKIIKSHRRFFDQGKVEIKILSFLKRHEKSANSFFVQMLDNFYFRKHLCVVFELLSFSLFDLLKANSFRGLSLSLVKRFTKQILQGLNFLRKNSIIHCDLKPENLILTNPAESSIKIIDLGSSCFENEKIYFYIQSRIYRAPEIILGVPYTAAIDVWSLGCIIVELATGRPLFQGQNEFDQLLAIMEYFNYPPEEVLKVSEKIGKFFNADRTLKCCPSAKPKNRVPGTKKIEEKIKINDWNFIDFVKRCLEWVPEKRITPEEGLLHPWLTENTKLKIRKNIKSPN